MSEPRVYAQCLSAELVALIERDNSLRLLQACGVEVAFSPTGWRAVVGGREIVNPDIDVVIRRGLAVLRGRRDLWPSVPTSALAR